MTLPIAAGLLPAQALVGGTARGATVPADPLGFAALLQGVPPVAGAAPMQAMPAPVVLAPDMTGASMAGAAMVAPAATAPAVSEPATTLAAMIPIGVTVPMVPEPAMTTQATMAPDKAAPVVVAQPTGNAPQPVDTPPGSLAGLPPTAPMPLPAGSIPPEMAPVTDTEQAAPPEGSAADETPAPSLALDAGTVTPPLAPVPPPAPALPVASQLASAPPAPAVPPALEASPTGHAAGTPPRIVPQPGATLAQTALSTDAAGPAVPAEAEVAAASPVILPPRPGRPTRAGSDAKNKETESSLAPAMAPVRTDPAALQTAPLQAAPAPAPADAAPPPGVVPTAPSPPAERPAMRPEPAPQPTPAPAPAVPPRLIADAGHQVALRVARAAEHRIETISVDLRPPELGRVEVRLSFRDGAVHQVVVAADRPETFQSFTQDRAQLEQQLARAGIDLGSGGLDLRHGDMGRQDAEPPPRSETTGLAAEEHAATEPPVAQRARALDSLIDIIA